MLYGVQGELTVRASKDMKKTANETSEKTTEGSSVKLR